MEFDQNLKRAVRLARLPYYIKSLPHGITVKELAKLCGVSVRTIQRDLNTLQNDLKIPIAQEKNRYSILDDYILPPVFFTLYEAVALFLASRLAIRHTDESNPHVADALYKISGVLPEDLADKIKRSVNTIRNKRTNPDFIQIFEQISLAWTTHSQVIMQYQSLHSLDTKEWILEPYFIEMSGIGDSTYVIGHAIREGRDGVITFKLDRIKKLEFTGKNYEIPPNLEIEKYLDSSWGVVWGDEIEVLLKFSPQVTRRVKESVWHPSQILTDLPEGGCLLNLQVGSLLEITPWIRSWGPDVEVIGPPELRERFCSWSKQLYGIYCSPEG